MNVDKLGDNLNIGRSNATDAFIARLADLFLEQALMELQEESIGQIEEKHETKN